MTPAAVDFHKYALDQWLYRFRLFHWVLTGYAILCSLVVCMLALANERPAWSRATAWLCVAAMAAHGLLVLHEQARICAAAESVLATAERRAGLEPRSRPRASLGEAHLSLGTFGWFGLFMALRIACQLLD